MSAQRATILLVDDESSLRFPLRAFLERENYAVLEAGSGHEALVVVRGLERPLDLLVTDVVMPDMSGPELARALRQEHPALRVLYMSGYAEVALPAGEGRDVAFISKPFIYMVLVEKVREMLAPA